VKNLGFALTAAALLLPACSRHSNEIQDLGSETMFEVAGALAEEYHHLHPEIVVSVAGGGSGTGISSLINGDIDIANCSRAMTDGEVAQAKQRGHEPVQHKVGYDGIAIFVHKSNPIAVLTLAQLKEIFIDGGKIKKWSDLGVKMPDPAMDTIVLASRQNSSGTYEYFREGVLEKGRFDPRANNLNGSTDLVAFVKRTPAAIGYAGLAAADADVRMVPVKKAEGAPAVTPSIATVLDQTYPISRPLFMYTLANPRPEVQAYLDWVLSDAGQRVLEKKGYPPLRKL